MQLADLSFGQIDFQGQPAFQNSLLFSDAELGDSRWRNSLTFLPFPSLRELYLLAARCNLASELFLLNVARPWVQLKTFRGLEPNGPLPLSPAFRFLSPTRDLQTPKSPSSGELTLWEGGAGLGGEMKLAWQPSP